MNPRSILLCGSGVALAMSMAASVARGEDGIAFFEKKIRPVLIESCYECHSVEAGKRKGGLYLDNRESLLLGGDSGSPLDMDHAAASLLVRAMTHEPDVEAMPPEEKLSDAVIADFEKWIAMGAPDPREGSAPVEEAAEIDFEEARKFWSFQSITDPEPPEVSDESWPRSDIDHFILAKLESKSLRPAQDADKATLLRRVTMALTGMPPTIADQDAFFVDESDGALAAVVDRLLNTKDFAERWGRHWLDICRYADTSGGGRAMPLPDAWRFRDYVIDSFQKDKPLDQLIREHIAGDLLPADTPEQRNEQITGTGFLVLGPHNYENQDKALLDLEIADEQMDTIGRAFLGMTIGCARCHDHKFDPIPTRDYYSMAGIFLSTESVRHSNVSKWSTRALAPDPEVQARYDAVAKEESEIEMRLKELKADTDRLAKTIKSPEPLGILVDDTEAEFVGNWPESAKVRPWFGSVYRHDDRKHKGEKRGIYRTKIKKAGRYEVRISYNGQNGRSRTVPVTVAHSDGESVVLVNQRQEPGVDGLFHSIGFYEFGEGTATVTIGTKGTSDGHVIADAVQWISEGAEEEPVNEEQKEKATLWAELQKEKKALDARKKKLEKEKPKLPTTMGVLDASSAEDTAVRVRGMAHQLGETVPRGFLQVVDLGAGESSSAVGEGSGRLELAEWVASPHNPLTARVLANRIWLHLLGEGLVASPDNFGFTGSAPSHPELLDYLASRLIENGWSAKKLIREIILSRTWQMASDGADNRAAAVDPENMLLWKAKIRRMYAESLRDTILVFSGDLDTETTGPSLPKGFKSEFDYEFTTKRRSVYLPVFRNQMHEMFTTFDFANPNFVVGKRSDHAVPTQSLFLINSPFVHESASAMAESVLEEGEVSDGLLLEQTWRTILGRNPTEEEAKISLEFLRAERAEMGQKAAWAAVIRGLFTCVDFQYIR
ncbi:MAG: DUF1553 domain-containing protein [Verrucomicrobiota bacterium]